MNRDPGQLVVEDLTFAGVNAGPHVEADSVKILPDCEGTTNRTGGSIERRAESVACVIDLSAPIALQLGSHHPVVLLEQIAPSTISQLRGTLSGVNDVGEQNGRQHPIGVWPSSNARQEFLHLVEDGVLTADP